MLCEGVVNQLRARVLQHLAAVWTACRVLMFALRSSKHVIARA